MFDRAAALALLQYGDSAYPAGGFAFSWGIEGLAADGCISTPSDLDDVIDDHLSYRWALMDRPLLAEAWPAAGIEALAAIDRYAEAATPSAEMREGSRRAGRALLGVSARLGRDLSLAYRAAIAAGAAHGHMPVVQAVVYREIGVGLEAAELLSGWTLVTGLVSAATRLGTIGHLEAQSSLAMARKRLSEVLADPVPPGTRPASFTPMIDIAMTRGPSRHVRMFAT
jgi:urease accessory protein